MRLLSKLSCKDDRPLGLLQSILAQKKLLRLHFHASPRRKAHQEPKTDKERAKLGLPLREPWFETKPFDEKRKNFILRLKEVLKGQHNHKIEVADLGQMREELDVVRNGKARKIATYVRQFPPAFHLRTVYTHNNKKETWCGFSAAAQKLLEEESHILQAFEPYLVQKLQKVLMISVKNRLPLDTINLVRESLGLPFDFRESLVNKYPDSFFVKERKGRLYLELNAWDETLAVSALEKNAQMQQEGHGGKSPKKGKKQVSKSVAVSALERESDEQEILTREGHEQEFQAREDHGQESQTGGGHELETLTREVYEQESLTREGVERGTLSIFNLESEGHQQEILHVLDLKSEGRQQETIAVSDLTFKDHHSEILAVSDLGTDAHQKGTLVMSNLESEVHQHLSDLEVETHNQETLAVFDHEAETHQQENLALSDIEAETHSQEILALFDLEADAHHHETLASSCFETDAYQQENLALFDLESKVQYHKTPTPCDLKAKAHEDETLAFSELETEVDEHETLAFSDLETEDQHQESPTENAQAVFAFARKAQQHETLTGSTKSDILADDMKAYYGNTKDQQQQGNRAGSHENSAYLRFPWKNKKGLQPRQRRAEEIEAFQSTMYISPYKNSRDLRLPLNSLTAEKFAVAVLHEFLSLTLEKRATLQQLEQLQRAYGLPDHLLDFLLRYDGIFYVVQGATKSHVFLKEAYKESCLVEKEPLVLWQQRFVELAFSSQQPDISEDHMGMEKKEVVLKGYYAYKGLKGYFGNEGCKIRV